MARLDGIVRYLVLGMLIAAAGGCSNALVFTTSTVTAIDINTVENGQQNVTVGYKRFEGVVMPVRAEKKGPARNEAYSVVAATRYDTGGLLPPNLGGTHVKTVFATGKAASLANAPRAVANLFSAFSGDLFDPEAAFLIGEVNDTLSALAEPQLSAAVSSLWQYYIGRGEPNQRWYTIRLIQQESDDQVLSETLIATKALNADGGGAALSDEEKAAPGTALIKLLNAAADDPDQLDSLVDTIGPHLPGPDMISQMSGRDMVVSFLELSAQKGEVVDLRESLKRVHSAACS